MTRKFGLLSVLLVALPVMAAPPSAISGYVKSVSGVPQMGAVVEIFTSAALVGTRVFTDAKGYYSADDLQPGIYQIKVTAASFLPSLRENVNVRTGTRVLVNLTLSTLADALQLLPPRRSSSSDADDWHWTLRSAANRPILRFDDQQGPLVVVS
ncbi:MAG TPA: carboxypeptidase regulatory-like domain-containing protein, partial [Candidatus Solibacter sp.]|nr:carboxypeptidase regulatory-like domain-containing protein [Candidatus Solibacter sp.]